MKHKRDHRSRFELKQDAMEYGEKLSIVAQTDAYVYRDPETNLFFVCRQLITDRDFKLLYHFV